MEKIEIRKIKQAAWGFSYVRPRSEKKVAEHLRSMGIPCYLPTVPHAYMMHSTKIVTELPMFPSYLFLCLGRSEATDLRYQEKRIIRINLLFEEDREQLLIQELHALQQCEDLAKTSEILINPGIQKGDRVLVTTGPLKNLTAEVVRRDDRNNSIIINITILEQHIEYPVSADELTKMTE